MKIIILLTILFSFDVYATVRVAVIDTGINITKAPNVKLCNTDHKDFSASSIVDTNGHGTNVSEIIAKNNKDNDYCIYAIKFYSENTDTLKAFVQSLVYVNTLKVDIVNLSVSGSGFSKLESILIKQLLDKGVKVVVAAGNDNKDISKKCDVYPACYDDRIYIIGNKSNKSNYGKQVDFVLNGNRVNAGGKVLSGSSQSAAIFSGILVDILSRK